MEKKTIYFLCTGNSCRSQIAEGLGKELLADKAHVHSAGIEAHGLNPKAIEIMDDIKINIRGQKSELLDQGLLNNSDLIITLCGSAQDRCPAIPSSAKHLHWDLPDPAKAQGTALEIKRFFKSVRDEIENRIIDLGKGL